MEDKRAAAEEETPDYYYPRGCTDNKPKKYRADGGVRECIGQCTITSYVQEKMTYEVLGVGTTMTLRRGVSSVLLRRLLLLIGNLHSRSHIYGSQRGLKHNI